MWPNSKISHILKVYTVLIFPQILMCFFFLLCQGLNIYGKPQCGPQLVMCLERVPRSLHVIDLVVPVPLSLFYLVFIYCWTCSHPKYNWNTIHWTAGNKQSYTCTSVLGIVIIGHYFQLTDVITESVLNHMGLGNQMVWYVLFIST